MFEERDTKRDIFALAMLVGVALLALAMLTYDPADPPVDLVYPFNQLYQQDVVSYPVNEQTTNACGPGGALVASIIFDALGIGAYYALISLIALTVLLLRRREIDSPIVRTVGWCMSLVGGCALATMLCPKLTPGPVLGAGGYLGALFATILKLHFAAMGGFLLAASLLVVGLLLCTDYVLVHLGLFLGSLTLATMMGRPRPKLRAFEEIEYDNEENEEEAGEEEDGEDDVSIRVGGRKITVHELGDDEVDEDEDEDEDEAEEDYEDGVYEEDEYEDGEHEEEEEEEEEEQVAGTDQEDDETHDDDELVDKPQSPLIVKTPASKMAADAAGAFAARRGRRRLAALRVRRPPEPEDREEVMNQLDEAAERTDDVDYELPSRQLLIESDEFSYDEQTKEVRRKAKILEQTFESFGFDVKVVEIETGPVIAQYEVQLEKGLRLSKITGLADDLAIALRVPSVRIVAPIPGKNTVGIEVPNEERQLVRLREVMEESSAKTKKMKIPIFLGKDVSGNSMAVDLARMPHLLIAGRTGTGKSVCLNAIITSILMTRRPDEVRMLMIDPKMVELSGYKSLPHLMHPVVTDMRKAEAILAWAVEKMEERYALLAKAGVRQLSAYNQLGREELLSRIEPEDEIAKTIPTHMPYIVIVADEIADMMMTAGKEVEQHIIRLAQKSRAVGIHLILATQKPTVDVITGLIKSNLPARLAFQVASRTDSRVVLDEMGADKLLGNGDMLFLWPGTSTLLRGQGTFVSDEEINAVVEASSKGEQHFVKELVHLKVDDGSAAHTPESLKKRDELYERAIEVVVTEGRGSVSLLQRALGIGYGRAARLIDFMAEDGIVGSYAGSQAREVLLTMDDVHRMQSGEHSATNGATAGATNAATSVVDEIIAANTATNIAAEPSRPKKKNKQKNAKSASATATSSVKARSSERVSALVEGESKNDIERVESTEMIIRDSELLEDDIREAFNPALDDEIEDVDDLLKKHASGADAIEFDEDEDDEEEVENALDAKEIGEEVDEEEEYEYEDAEGEYEDDPDAEYEYVYEDEDEEGEEDDPDAEYEYEDEYEESA